MLALQAVFPDISAEEAPPSGVGRQDITHVVFCHEVSVPVFIIRHDGTYCKIPNTFLLLFFLYSILNKNAAREWVVSTGSTFS